MKKLFQAALALAGSLSSLCHAEPLPLWEVGAGVGALSIPDYRGSDVRSNYAFPVPYFIYRGDILKADRNGMRAALFQSEAFDINLSLNATLQASSKNNPARAGMADLKSTVEVGPRVDFNLWHSADRKIELDFRVPVRAAVTLESSPKFIGWLFAPTLNLNTYDTAGMRGWKASMAGGPVFSTQRYNGYFYSVSPGEANAARPAYTAPGGYSGAQVTALLSKRFRRYWAGAFVRYDNLSGAVFNDSPLVRRNSALTGGVAVAWVFGSSSTLVDAPE